MSRLLIVNNLPSFYRAAPFNHLAREWGEQTGGEARLIIQSRRDTHRRPEWFYFDESELTMPHAFLAEDTMKIGSRVTHTPVFPTKMVRDFAPTHVLIPGWDIPTCLTVLRWRQQNQSTRLLSWVESNPTTSQHRGRLANAFRRAYLQKIDAALVPTAASADYVRGLRGSDLPVLQLPNPVDLSRLGETDAPSRVIFLGDLSRRKGFDLLSKALAGKSQMKGIAFGTDTEGLAKHAPSNLEVRHGRPLSEIVPTLTGGDILAIPSRRDPAPLTFSEGMALGLRTVVSDGTAYSGTLPNGVISFISGDSTDLMRALREAHRGQRPLLTDSERYTAAHWGTAVTRFLMSL